MLRNPTMCAALAVLVILAGCKEPVAKTETIRPVRAMKIGDVEAIGRRAWPGQAQATQEVNLAFRVAGPLVTRPVNVGDEVTEGQVVAKIDPRDFEVQLRNVQAQLQESKTALVFAIEEFDRGKDAHDKGAVSDIEMARLRDTRDRAAAQVESMEASVATAADALDDTDLRAPFDGEVVATYVENFENVQAQQAIVRVLDDSKIEMVIEVPEHLISLAPYVEEIACTFEAFPEIELAAEIKEVGREASDLTRTYPVTLIMDQPENARILPGMTGFARGRARPPGEEIRQGAEVPVGAVVSGGETSYVWIINEATGAVTRRDIGMGELTDRGILVTGLEVGEWIATAGVHYLHEGQQVTIMDAASVDAEEGAS